MGKSKGSNLKRNIRARGQTHTQTQKDTRQADKRRGLEHRATARSARLSDAGEAKKNKRAKPPTSNTGVRIYKRVTWHKKAQTLI